jgi:hypothetical protein
MADWTLPSLTSTYSDFLTFLKARDDDSAKMFDGVGTGLPTNTIKWNSTNNSFEKYNGTTWSILTTNLLMTCNSVYNAALGAGTTINDSAAAATNILWTSNKINSFAAGYVTTGTLSTTLANYLLKNGENGTLTLGTNDASAVNIETSNINRLSVSGTGNISIAAPSAGVALTITPFAGSNALTSTGTLQGDRLVSTIAQGTAPLTVTSTTKVANLNADLLNGMSAVSSAIASSVVIRDASANAINLGAATGTSFTGTSFNGITALATVAPIMDGTATIGTGTTVARADHIHPIDTSRAPLASPALTGTPTAPTATAGTNTTQLATTAFVTTADNLKAPLASPALTGTPTAPTATAGTNTTQLATTAMVHSAITNDLNVAGSAPMYACRAWVNFNGTVSSPTPRASGNISSITKSSTGIYTINFVTAMPDANYAVTANKAGYNQSTDVNIGFTMDTTYIQLHVLTSSVDGNNNPVFYSTDDSIITCAIHR